MPPHSLPKRPTPGATYPSAFPKLGATRKGRKPKPWALTSTAPSSPAPADLDTNVFPELGTNSKPLATKAILKADDGTSFTVSTVRLAKTSETLREVLLLPVPEPIPHPPPVPEIPILDVCTPAVAFFASFVECLDAYSAPPTLAIPRPIPSPHQAHPNAHLVKVYPERDQVFTDLIKLQELYALKSREFYQAIIRRLEIDEGHDAAQTIFVFAALGKFSPVVARYSTFLLSPTHVYQFRFRPDKFWWTRTLHTKKRETFDELGHMMTRWNDEMDTFIDACTHTDFKWEEECRKGLCPTYKHHRGFEAAFYIDAAMCIWATIEAFPQCVCHKVLLVAMKTEYPEYHCDACASNMVDSILRHYDWCVTPASWRMGNLSRDLNDMLFDYMKWSVTGPGKNKLQMVR